MALKKYCMHCPYCRFDMATKVDFCLIKEQDPNFECFVGTILRNLFSEIHDKLIKFEDELNQEG